MGELLEYAIERRNRLLQKKEYIQNFNMTQLNNQITKLNNLITILETAGG